MMLCRNSASEVFANLSILSIDELLRIFLFFDFGHRLLFQTTCLYQSFIIQLVVFIHIFGLGGIICYTCFPHRMLTSLDFYYVTLHVTGIYLFYNICILIL